MSIMNTASKYLARGAGVTALYLCIRDAHVNGKIQADINKKSKDARAMQYFLNNTLTVDKPSMTKIKLQNGVYRYEQNERIRGFINSATGYFKGFGSMLVSDVCVLGLGLAALFAKGRALPFAKLSGLGLAAAGVFSFIKDGLGVGKHHDLTLPTE